MTIFCSLIPKKNTSMRLHFWICFNLNYLETMSFLTDNTTFRIHEKVKGTVQIPSVLLNSQTGPTAPWISVIFRRLQAAQHHCPQAVPTGQELTRCSSQLVPLHPTQALSPRMPQPQLLLQAQCLAGVGRWASSFSLATSQCCRPRQGSCTDSPRTPHRPLSKSVCLLRDGNSPTLRAKWVNENTPSC